MFAISGDIVGSLRYGFLYPMQVVALGITVVFLLGYRVKNWVMWAVAAGALVALILGPFVVDPPNGVDLGHRWREGCDVRNGFDPYRNDPCVYPPHAFVIFGQLARFPFDKLLVYWTVINIGACALLLLAARGALAVPGTVDDWSLPAPALGLLTAVMALSLSSRDCVSDGQLSLLVSLLLFGALWAQHGRRPICAGAALALAVIKPATPLPFLLLYRRRADFVTWISLAAIGLAMFFLGNPADQLVNRVRECLENISHLSTPGHMNNFSHPVNADMVSLDRAVFYLGVSDRTLVKAAQYVILIALGAWVGYRVAGRNRLVEPAAICLLAFYAALFLYHRLYDMSILALPLLYATGRARHETGRARWLYVGCTLSVLGVLYTRLETVKFLSYHPGPNLTDRVLEAIVVPSATWLVLAGMGLLVLAERYRTSARPSSLVLRRSVLGKLPSVVKPY